MQTVTRTLTNLMTGKIRQEVLTKIGDTNKYIAPDGFIYVRGALGWFCVNPNHLPSIS